MSSGLSIVLAALLVMKVVVTALSTSLNSDLMLSHLYHSNIVSRAMHNVIAFEHFSGLLHILLLAD